MVVPLPTSKTSLRSRLSMRWYSWVFLAGAILYGIAWAMHWDDRGLLWVLERFESSAERRESVWLPDYHAVIDAKLLPGMEKDEASDLSYNPQTKTLFSVMGKNPFLVELSLQGDVLRKMPLNGWNNPEGVAVMENGLMAVVDERDHSLTVVKVDAGTTALNKADFPSYDLGPSKDQNKAFEAVTWDKRNQQLVLGEERPPALFSTVVPASTLMRVRLCSRSSTTAIKPFSMTVRPSGLFQPLSGILRSTSPCRLSSTRKGFLPITENRVLVWGL